MPLRIAGSSPVSPPLNAMTASRFAKLVSTRATDAKDSTTRRTMPAQWSDPMPSMRRVTVGALMMLGGQRKIRGGGGRPAARDPRGAAREPCLRAEGADEPGNGAGGREIPGEGEEGDERQDEHEGVPEEG